MNEATLIIVIGLIFDVAGALLIVGPLRHRKSLNKRLIEVGKEIVEFLQDRKEGKPQEITPQTNKNEIDKLATKFNETLIDELKGYPKYLLGIVLLVVGFILQIIGNLIQNPLI